MRARSRVAWLAFVGVTSACAGGGTSPSSPPAPIESRPIAFPAIEDFTLENGLRVVLVSYGTQPVVSALLYARGGWSSDPNGLEGTAALAATVLTQGTTSRSAPEFAGAIEGVGGSLSALVGRDFLTISSTVLVEHLDLAFTLMADAALNATFPEEEIELAREQTLSNLQADLGYPAEIVFRRFSSLVYGGDHPYGSMSTPESVGDVSRDHLVSYRDRVLRPRGALLLVAGRVGRTELEALVRRHLGSWTDAVGIAPSIPAPPEGSGTRITLVHRPGAPQSAVAVGHLGLDAGSEDYFPLVVLNRVLGGGSDSRLFRILREERGWTYGAYSQFSRSMGRGFLIAEADVRTEVTDSTVVEILAQMQRLREETVPEAELEQAKSYLAGSFPLELETADQVAGQLAGTLLLGLPIEDVTRYPERVRSVTVADVRRVAQARLHPDRAVIVVAGDAEALLARLEAVAPVDLLDVEGNPLPRSALGPGAGIPIQ